MKTTIKKKYTMPVLNVIRVDNEISLILNSMPEFGPWDTPN